MEKLLEIIKDLRQKASTYQTMAKNNRRFGQVQAAVQSEAVAAAYLDAVKMLENEFDPVPQES